MHSIEELRRAMALKMAGRGSIGTAILAATGCSAMALAASVTFGAAARNGASAAIGRRALPPTLILAQSDQEIPPDQIDKYVAVYKAMQHNHSLSVEQAAAAQGLTLQAFRSLEARIERNDVARDSVRRALAKSAQQPTPAPGGSARAPQP
jgi:hypothetical protein